MTPNQNIKIAIMRLEDAIKHTVLTYASPPGQTRVCPYPERREAVRLMECALRSLTLLEDA